MTAGTAPSVNRLAFDATVHYLTFLVTLPVNPWLQLPGWATQ